MSVQGEWTSKVFTIWTVDSVHSPPSGPENPGGQAQSERPIPPTDRSRTSNDPALLSCLTRQRGNVDISLVRTNFGLACRQRTCRRQVKKEKIAFQNDERRHCDTCPAIVDMMWQGVAREGASKTG
jgi:hypothetical protein